MENRGDNSTTFWEARQQKWNDDCLSRSKKGQVLDKKKKVKNKIVYTIGS